MARLALLLGGICDLGDPLCILQIGMKMPKYIWFHNECLRMDLFL